MQRRDQEGSKAWAGFDLCLAVLAALPGRGLSLKAPQVILPQIVDWKELAAAVGEVPVVPSIARAAVREHSIELVDRPDLLTETKPAVGAKAGTSTTILSEEEGLADGKAPAGDQLPHGHSCPMWRLGFEQLRVIGR